MKLLLDTHTFLWFINDSPQLSADAKNLLESEVDLALSVASLWEIAIKASLGKLTLPDTYDKFIPQQLTLFGDRNSTYQRGTFSLGYNTAVSSPRSVRSFTNCTSDGRANFNR